MSSVRERCVASDLRLTLELFLLHRKLRCNPLYNKKRPKKKGVECTLGQRKKFA